MAEVFRRLFAGHGPKPANLLRREGTRTARTRLVRQEHTDPFTQALGLVFQLGQVRAALHPALPPQAYRLFAQAPLLRNGLVRAPLAGR